MSVIGEFPLRIEENADMPTLTFTNYPNGQFNAQGQPNSPFDYTGWVASMMIRVNINDMSPVMTLTPVLGGTAGTLAITITNAQATSLVTLLPNLTGFYDVLLISPGNLKSHFIPLSTFEVLRSVTR